MRLFHVSEDPGIHKFIPRTPTRDDLKKDIPLVWAINENKLANYLFPRNCPRIIYSKTAMNQDSLGMFSSETVESVITVEKSWLDTILNTTLYIYEFGIDNFHLQDAVAGYYTSMCTEVPINKVTIQHPLIELTKYNIELRLVDYLDDMKENNLVKAFDFSMIKMNNARKRASSNID